MPDTEVQSTDADELDPLLAALLADEDDEDSSEADETEENFAKHDQKVAKDMKAVKEYITRTENQKQADKLYERFMADASDTAREIFAVLADDDMTPAQMKKVIDATNRKAKTIEEKATPEGLEQEVESRVEQELASRWGVAPIGTGNTSQSAEDKQTELMARIARGDVNAYLEATFSPPKM
jgi:hypothetical protein